METTTEEKRTRKVLEAKHDRECLECKKQYKAKYEHSKFCSDFCRSTFNRKAASKAATASKLNGIDKMEKETNVPSLFPKDAAGATPVFHNLPAHLAIAVDLLKNDGKRWEHAYNQEREKRKEIQAKYIEAKDELAKIKVDHKIESIENAKPSGLSGLAENPLVLKLMEHAGPALGAWLMKMQGESTPGQLMSGMEGQLDEVTQKQLSDINSWYLTLSDKAKAVLYDVLHSLGQSKTPEILNDTLLRIQNILKSGSVITPYAGYGTI
jgi:hypothetical protein